jgi:hypothetical protein
LYRLAALLFWLKPLYIAYYPLAKANGNEQKTGSLTFCLGRMHRFTHEMIDKFQGFPCQQKSFGRNPEKQQACEVGWGIANFCIKGIKAKGSAGKKIAAPAVFVDLWAMACAAKKHFC